MGEPRGSQRIKTMSWSRERTAILFSERRRYDIISKTYILKAKKLADSAFQSKIIGGKSA